MERRQRPGSALSGALGTAIGGREPLVDSGLSRGLVFSRRRAKWRSSCSSRSVLDGPLEATSERAARVSLKAQIARLERELSGIVAGRFPYIPAPRAARSAGAPRARPRLPDLGELERERDHLAGRVQELRRTARGAHRARAPRAGAARADAPRTRALQVRAPTGPGSRTGRLRGLGGPTPPRPDRDARRLVAAQALVRLSVSQGVALQARPRSPDSSSSARRRL